MKLKTGAIVFLFSAAYLGMVFASSALGDPDAYYHLWMAKRIVSSGPVMAFPWLPFTTLAAHYADQHFLYHLALAPFVGVLGDFWGIKIATVLFASLAMTALYLLLKSHGVRRPELWALTLLFAPGFVFRLLLTKATALALTALFLYLIALKKESRAGIFALAFAYVWLHGGWPLLVIVAAIDAVFRRSLRFAKPTLLGLAAGLAVNPYFPQNLSFYWEQIVQVAVIGRSAFGVAVGNEWYPADFGSLIGENLVVFLPVVSLALATIYAVYRLRPMRAAAIPAERRRAVFLFATLAGVLLLMTLRQVRHKEYFLPIFLCASALACDAILAVIDVRALRDRAQRKFGRAWGPLLAAGFLAAAVFGGREALSAQRDAAGMAEWTRFRDAGAWMRTHLPADAVVFQTGWSDTPYLLYGDDAQRYIAGLDPRFFSDQDIAKYWEWRDIGEGRRRAGLAESIERDFDARYVFVKRDNEPLRPLMKKDPSFERVYQDAEAEVWRIRPAVR